MQRWLGAGAGVGAAAVALAVSVVLNVSATWGMLIASGMAGVIAWVVAVAGDKLQKYFSEVHTVLILASTSSLGLGLGWLGHRIFNTGL